MGLADLHIHTSYSWDGTSTMSAIMQSAKNKKLNIIAITDHDTIAGHDEARELAPKYNMQVIPGIEISTADGHLLAYFINKPIPAHLSLIRTIELIGAQGGICIAAHPVARFVHAISAEVLSVAACIPAFEDIFVGVEAINAGLLYQKSNVDAGILARKYGLSLVGNSDSHIYWTIGDAVTEFSGNSISSLRKALINRETKPILISQKREFSYYTKHVSRRVLRMMGWVANYTLPNNQYVMQRLPGTSNQ
jgi:predicted metal-dependent phosphoesterase TrpH